MIGKRVQNNANRRRQRYQGQRVSLRYLLTIFIATIAAIAVHIGIYYVSPKFISWSIMGDAPVQDEEEEIFRVITQPIEEVEREELPPIELPEPEILEPEEVEIDILDAEYEELVLAPGDTNLPLPEMEIGAENDLEVELGAEMSLEVFEEAREEATEQLSLPEPTPINENPIAVQAQGFLSDEDVSELLEGELLDHVESSAALPSDTRSLSDLLKVKQLGSKSGVARLGADVLFSFGDHTLRNSARVTLIQLAALIRKNPQTRFIIEGHTDSFGSEAYNSSLSLRRAAAVRAWLAKNRIPLSRVYLRACGASRPLAEHDGSRDQQALNRRVEIHMRSSSEALPANCIDASVDVLAQDDSP